MYMDTYVVSGIAIIVLTCVVLGYVGYYGYRHIKQDIKKSDQENGLN